MERLPGHERAVIPAEKLRNYLDPAHPTGSHQARVFESALVDRHVPPVNGAMLELD
jgi:hypothetical protein